MTRLFVIVGANNDRNISELARNGMTSRLRYIYSAANGISTLKFQIRKRPLHYCKGLHLKLAERTGLEPATPGVTGRYSNQLNYRSFSKLLTQDAKCFLSR